MCRDVLDCQCLSFFFLVRRRSPRSTRTAHSFPTRRSSDLSVVSLLALVVWELNHDDPVIDPQLLRNRNFGLTCLVMAATGMILFGTTQLIPQMLQQVLGYSALDAGLALTAGGLATLVAVPFAGKLSDQVDVRSQIGR